MLFMCWLRLAAQGSILQGDRKLFNVDINHYIIKGKQHTAAPGLLESRCLRIYVQHTEFCWISKGAQAKKVRSGQRVQLAVIIFGRVKHCVF